MPGEKGWGGGFCVFCFGGEGRAGYQNDGCLSVLFTQELLANTCVLGYLGWLIFDFIFWSHLIFDIFTV